MTAGRVVVIGAVHEALPLVTRLLAERAEDFVGLVTFEQDLLVQQAGWVDLVSHAADADVPVLRVRNLNSTENVAALSQWDPELLVVVGWTRLLGSEVLRVPRRGTVGFHASLLPENRGRAPVNWQIIRGDTVGGNTMMLLDEGADTGDIVDQVALDISDGDTCATVYDRVAQAGATMLMRNLDALLAGRAPRTRQDPHEGSENGRRIPEMGVTDWRRSARELHDWVRAQTRPYPGAFTTLHGRTIRLWGSQVADTHTTAARPGEVVRSADDTLLVQCGVGRLLITDWDSDDGHAVDETTVFDAIDDAMRDWALGLAERP